MKEWVLSESSFDRFLAGLDSDRERAGQKYEALRRRLVKFFEWRACPFADDLADEALDRVVRKTDAGEQIEDYTRYTYGVARLLYLENRKKQEKQEKRKAVVIDLPTTTESYDDQLGCLEDCLRQLSDSSRVMILRYYRHERQAKIDYRRKLAEELGISLNTLRVKANRIRVKLEECVLRCLGENAG